MINHIDLSTVLRRTVCDLYSDLVTRSTGAAVRLGIEQQLAEVGERSLTVIDFSHVGLLDFSCADEIVAKLLLRYGGGPGPADLRPREAYFLFRGLRDIHLDAIEAVLERHGLAIVAEIDDGATVILGPVDDADRRAWNAVHRLGRVQEPADVAREAGLDPNEVESRLGELCRRRLVMRFEDTYVPVGAGA